MGALDVEAVTLDGIVRLAQLNAAELGTCDVLVGVALDHQGAQARAVVRHVGNQEVVGVVGGGNGLRRLAYGRGQVCLEGRCDFSSFQVQGVQVEHQDVPGLGFAVQAGPVGLLG